MRSAYSSDPILTICLISPLPPPYGGIAHWTTLVQRKAAASGQIKVMQVDTAPRWRAVYDYNIFKRVIGATLQFVRDYLVFLFRLLEKPDVVHLTTSGGLGVLRDVAVCATARLWRVPLVYHIRFGRVPVIAKANTYEWRLMSLALRMARVVIAISADTAETLSHYLPGVQVERIPNPVDLAELTFPVEPRSGDRIALFLGWVLPSKGIEELLQAWTELAPDGWNLLVVGPGELAYQERLLQRRKPRNLHFVGELDHAAAMQLMAQCDLFVLPSHTEGFPNVILEAMALGKPVVATEVGAIPEMLAGGCGWVIQLKDVAALKSALAQLIQDDLLRQQLGEKARQKVRQEYAIDVVFAHYVQIWQSVAKRQRKEKSVFE